MPSSAPRRPSDALQAVSALAGSGPDRDELLDLIEELAMQGAGDGRDIDHMHMSLYEEVCELLLLERPQRWQPTGSGIRRIKERKVNP